MTTAAPLDAAADPARPLTGLVHRFPDGEKAAAYLAAHEAHDPIPAELRAAGRPGVLARGAAAETMLDGADLYAAIAWDDLSPPGDAGAFAALGPTAACDWDEAGRLTRIVVTVEGSDAQLAGFSAPRVGAEPQAAAIEPPDDEPCDCGRPLDACSCRDDDEEDEEDLAAFARGGGTKGAKGGGKSAAGKPGGCGSGAGGFKPGNTCGVKGKGKKAGATLATVQGHPVYVKGGKVVGGGKPGLTHDARGRPTGKPVPIDAAAAPLARAHLKKQRQAERIRANAPGKDSSGIDHAAMAKAVKAKAVEHGIEERGRPGKPLDYRYSHGPPQSKADREHLRQAEAKGHAAVKIVVTPKVRTEGKAGNRYYVGDTAVASVRKNPDGPGHLMAQHHDDVGSHNTEHEHRTLKGAHRAARKHAAQRAHEEQVVRRLIVPRAAQHEVPNSFGGDAGESIHVRTLHRGRGSSVGFHRSGKPGIEADMRVRDATANFRKWTKDERDALDPESFGDIEHRLFPVETQDDLDAAARLIGRAKDQDAVKARLIRIAKRKGLTYPDAWDEAKMAAEGVPTLPTRTTYPGGIAIAESVPVGNPADGVRFTAATAADGVPSEVVRFSAVIPTSGRRVEGTHHVYPDALLFEAGDYASHNFSMDPEELWLAAERFAGPVPGNIEHTEFLKGRACEVRSVRLDPAHFGVLRGEVAVPIGLDAVLIDAERRLSCEWNRATKELTGVALTLNPRVRSAALMAAFTAGDDEAAGALAHELAEHPAEALDVFAGAVASFTDRKHTEHGKRHAQLIHEVTRLAYPAVCVGGPLVPAPAPAPAGSAAVPGSAADSTGAGTAPTAALAAWFRDHPEQLKFFWKTHDETLKHGATCPGTASMSGPPAGPRPPLARFRMSKYQKLVEAIGALSDEPTDDEVRALFRAGPRDVLKEVAAEAEPDPLAAFADNPHFKALKEKADRLEAESAARDAREAREAAAAFANEQADRLLLNRAATAALEAVLFTTSNRDRQREPITVTFTADDKSHTFALNEAIRAMIAAIPDNQDTRQLVDGGGNGNGKLREDLDVLFHKTKAADPDSQPVSEERRRRNLALTETGRAILADEDAKKRS